MSSPLNPRRRPIPLAIAGALFCFGSSVCAAGPATREHRLERTFETVLDYRYFVTLPEGYEGNPDRDWPMVLFLHGGGSPKPEQLRAMVAPLSKLPAIVVAPICPPSPDGGKFTNWHWKMLGALVRKVGEDYRVDPGMRSVIGHSMGGSAAWEMPFHEPEMFTKSVVSAGVCHPWSLRHYPKQTAVWVFVGEKDYMLKEQQETVSSAERFGVDVVETVWPGADHGGIFRRAMSHRPMLDWLVSKEDLRAEAAPKH